MCKLDVIYVLFGNSFCFSLQGSYSYRLPADDVFPGGIGPKTNVDSLEHTIIASTLLGSIMIFIPLSRYELLCQQLFKLLGAD